MTRLIWNPLIQLFSSSKETPEVCEIIAPYCQIGALKDLIASTDKLESVIVSWKVDDLARGIGSLAIYDELKQRGIPLYINKHLHAKLYIFDDSTALCCSGNATDKGLGISESQNIECGVVVELADSDFDSLRLLRDSSIRVDDELYKRFHDAVISVDVQKPTQKSLDDELYEVSHQGYLVSSLPLTPNPEDLISAINDDTVNKSPFRAHMRHDIQTYSISKVGGDVHQQLSRGFKSIDIVDDVYQLVKSNGSMGFGRVASHIHRNCRDTPIPYRSLVKDHTAILFDWMQFFFEDIYHAVPREYAQVLFDNDAFPRA